MNSDIENIVKNNPSPVKIKYSLNVIIEGETFEQLADGLTKAASQGIVSRISAAKAMNGLNVHPAPPPVTKQATLPKEADAKIEAAVENANEKKKVGRPKKSLEEHAGKVDEAEVPTEAAAIEIEPQTVVKTFTQKDCIDALAKVAEKIGVPGARECLVKFDAPRVASLNPEKYAEFIAHCETVLK